MTTVLVVDDEPIVRDVVVRYLQRDGFDTLEAGDGDEARSLIERSPPQLVVLDVMLPGTDGLALCRWIRERGNLPVIMLTALGDEADREGVRPPLLPCGARAAGVLAQPADEQRVGLRVGRRHGHARRPRPPPPLEDRARPGRAAAARDRLGRRLPVRAVIALAVAV